LPADSSICPVRSELKSAFEAQFSSFSAEKESLIGPDQGCGRKYRLERIVGCPGDRSPRQEARTAKRHLQVITAAELSVFELRASEASVTGGVRLMVATRPARRISSAVSTIGHHGGLIQGAHHVFYGPNLGQFANYNLS
jgi:hypothetical protein